MLNICSLFNGKVNSTTALLSSLQRMMPKFGRSSAFFIFSVIIVNVDLDLANILMGQPADLKIESTKQFRAGYKSQVNPEMITISTDPALSSLK